MLMFGLFLLIVLVGTLLPSGTDRTADSGIPRNTGEHHRRRQRRRSGHRRYDEYDEPIVSPGGGKVLNPETGEWENNHQVLRWELLVVGFFFALIALYILGPQ